jgi:hypothetical protein
LTSEESRIGHQASLSQVITLEKPLRKPNLARVVIETSQKSARRSMTRGHKKGTKGLKDRLPP